MMSDSSRVEGIIEGTILTLTKIKVRANAYSSNGEIKVFVTWDGMTIHSARKTKSPRVEDFHECAKELAELVRRFA
jgi:hypothetical protein